MSGIVNPPVYPRHIVLILSTYASLFKRNRSARVSPRTKETLQARMLKLQEDFKRLEEEELNESPAQAVKKRKRRKSSGKGDGK